MKILLLFMLLTVRAKSVQPGGFDGFRRLIEHFVDEDKRLNAKVDSLSNIVKKYTRENPDGPVTAAATTTAAAATTTTTTSPTTTTTTTTPTTTTTTTRPTTTITTTPPTTTTTTTTTTTIDCFKAYTQKSDVDKAEWEYVSPSGSDEWVQVGSRYLRYEKHKKNFDWASKHCQSYGGQIAYDDSTEANEHIKTKQTTVWIGASDVNMDGNFTWTDGTSVGAGKWAPNQPNNKGVENCAVGNWQKSGNWNNDNCDKRFSFFCQVDAIPPTVSGRYMRKFESAKNYKKSSAACKAEGGELAIVDDVAVQDWIDKQQNRGYNAYIGGTDKDKEGEWMWPNGQPVLIAKWDRNQPNSHDCIRTRLTKWYGEKCSRKMWYFCQIKSTC